MLSCDESIALLTLAVGDPLDPADRERLGDHVRRCAFCRREAENQQLVRGVLATRPVDPIPALLAEGVVARLGDHASRPPFLRPPRSTIVILATAVVLLSTARC